MATFKTLGDVVTGIQNQSKPGGVTYTVQASTVYPGFMDVLRNGTRTWSFLFPPVPGGAAWTGAATDSNPTGGLIQLIGPDSVSSKADAVQFVQSLV